ncbi:MAG TPA: hypothetical protein VGN64_07290 [Dyadobacter sp.]|jgi:hypothetical protein|nr:hypothetical protein [Dyadobacter sp.]
MANTVVGIFGNEFDAQKAQNYLLENGFADGNVDITTASYKPFSNDTSTDEDLFTKIGHFFEDLFGENESDAKRYIDAARSGTIVTVHALNANEADSVAGILDQFGALDVNENRTGNTQGQIFTDGAYSGEVIPAEVRGTDNTDLNTVEPYTRSSPADPLPASHQSVNFDNERTGQSVQRSRSRIFERSLQDHNRLRQQTLSHDGITGLAQAQDPDLDSYKDLDQTVANPRPISDQDSRLDQDASNQISDQERLRRLNLEP